MCERLSVDELLAMFERPPDVGRWVGSADSQEYLALATYFSSPVAFESDREPGHDRAVSEKPPRRQAL